MRSKWLPVEDVGYMDLHHGDIYSRYSITERYGSMRPSSRVEEDARMIIKAMRMKIVQQDTFMIGLEIEQLDMTERLT